MSQSPIDAEPVRQRAGSLSTYRAATLRTLPAADRHLVRRFSWGLTPELAGDVIKAGGGRRWFEQQLAPGSVADPWGTAVDSWFPTVRASPARINADARSGVRGSWEVAVDLSRRTICRRIHSRRQVHEVMVDLWSNLLHVPLFHTEAIFWRMDYDRVIRAHALTSFDAGYCSTGIANHVGVPGPFRVRPSYLPAL